MTINYNHDTGNYKLKQQTAKLSKIYDYSASSNMIICKVCHEVDLIVILEKANHGVISQTPFES